MQDTNAKWSRSGAYALADYLQELENGMGEEQEMDVVGIRCDFAEYPTAVEAYNDTSSEDELSEDDEDKALEWLRDNGQVIVFYGGVIISQ